MFFIFGLSPVKKNGEKIVRQHCPRCNDLRNYRETKIRQFISFFFIPIIPVSAPMTVFSCTACGYSVPEEQLRNTLEPAVGEPGAPAVSNQVVILCPRCEGPMSVPLTERRQGVTCPHCSMEFKLKGIKGEIPAATINENPQLV
jgi:DNA-directed RNA polymerase subunit RPC12/RpoP/predicted RNA-binding Zn-ribbon protein involved in translation (DUF1610 family)